MGGVLIFGSVFLSTILWARLDSLYLWLALGATTLFRRHRFCGRLHKNRQKTQRRFDRTAKTARAIDNALIVGGCLYWVANYPWNVSIPFFKATATRITALLGSAPLFICSLSFSCFWGSSNAVNLTDGMDGLAASVTFIAMSALTL
jgi:phospho-N-acetylmuramoyl-pentapeptide-transferase